MKTRKENRLTVINEEGRVCEFWNIEIKESIQDDGKTLKLFIQDIGGEKENETT